MVRVSDRKRVSSKLAFAFALLALVALLAACAAPSGSSGSGGQAGSGQIGQAVASTAATAATAAPAATSAPAATTAPAATAAPAATDAPVVATQAPAQAVGTSNVSFSKDLMPIFEKSCIKCHGGSDGTKGDLSLKTYDDMMKGGKDGQVVLPGDSKNSPIWQLTNNGKMPRRQPKLPQEHIDLIAK